MEPQAECMLVLMGATAEGKKELHRPSDGHAGERSKLEGTTRRLKARGLVVAPQVAIGDGALGFWKALDEAFPTTRHQRCWLHKTLNVLDKFPKLLQPNAHKDLREIWLSPDGPRRKRQWRPSPKNTRPSTTRPSNALIKDRQTLLTFFDLPADHSGPLANLEPDRERLRDGEASHRPA